MLIVIICYGDYSDINDCIGIEDKYVEEVLEFILKVNNFIKKNVFEDCDLICSCRWYVYILFCEISFII